MRTQHTDCWSARLALVKTELCSGGEAQTGRVGEGFSEGVTEFLKAESKLLS